MKLKILSLLLILGMMTNVGCTSSNDDATDIEAADGASTEFSDEGAALDADSSDEGSDVAATDEFAEDEVVDDSGMEGTDDFATDEEVVADTGDEEFVDEGAMSESAPPTDEVATTDELPADSMENGDSSAIVAEDGTAQEGTELADGSVSETPAEEGVFDNVAPETPEDTSSYAYSGDETTTGTDSADYSGYTEAPKYIPVKKIASVPYTKNGVLVNTVYLDRPGDTVDSIAEKIGTTREEIIKVNPNLSNGIKVGDKVYYNSPKRPQDSSRMLTYYEDNGLAPQSYVAQAGDNIRTVSKTLLGDQGSWKEVWATNLAVESKSELAAGTELKYWPDSSVAAPVMAEAAPEPTPAPTPETPQMPEPTPEAPIAANDTASATTPQDDFALPDDTATNGAAAGTVANVEPPPPPPPPPAAPQKVVASNDEKDLTFMLSAGGLLLVGVGVLLGIIRKGRSRKMSMNTHTQI